MLQKLDAFVLKLWPGLREVPADRRRMAAIDVFATLYSAPLALAGLIWLVLASDWTIVARQWPVCLALVLLLLPINRYSFFVLTELKPGMTSDVYGSLDGVLVWSAALLLGPVGLWLGVLSAAVRAFLSLRSEQFASARWIIIRNEVMNIMDGTLARLVALAVYRAAGGILPFPGIDLASMTAGLLATVVLFLLQQALSLPLYVFFSAMLREIDPGLSRFRLVALIFSNSGILAAGTPFAVLAAGLYAGYGLWLFLFFFGGLLAVSYLAYTLSRAVLRSQQQSRLMIGLESLARALLQSSPEKDALLARVREHIQKAELHLPGRLEIRLFPDQVILREPPHWDGVAEPAWEWLSANPGSHQFTPGAALPWGEDIPQRSTGFVAIEDRDNGQTIGGIYHSISTRGYIDKDLYRMYLPALESLANQVALALYRNRFYLETIANQRNQQELKLAGDIQGGFLPERFPDISGWKLSGILVSARDTSGDYFDFFALPDGRVAVVLADVADKGVGAALYMALSRAYLRGQALENDPAPGRVLSTLNRRVLEDTSSDLFVTLVYGVVAPDDGRFAYCNAGHPPPIVVRADSARPTQQLIRTGMAVGVQASSTWDEEVILLDPGDFVVIYSDGITDSRNDAGEIYGYERLVADAESVRGQLPTQVRLHLMESFRVFNNGAQDDDVTLLVLGREE